jgi:hypothetical protein
MRITVPKDQRCVISAEERQLLVAANPIYINPKGDVS